MLGSYCLRLEENRHDLFAVAVFDGPRKVANLKRDSAKLVHELMSMSKAKSGFYLRPLDVPSVKNRRIGPQQSCAVAFKCDEEDIVLFLDICNKQIHQLSGVYMKVMDLQQK